MNREACQLVIMAGGVGSRLWPLSTSQLPKQFVDVLGLGKSLLQITVERFQPLCPIENVWIVTSKEYYDIVSEQLPMIPSEHILLEPARRNTAPCIAYACSKIAKIHPDADIIVSPSDAFVLNTERFVQAVSDAIDFVDESDSERIVTIGICPNRPETGYGYICSDCASKGTISKVLEFKEKPDLHTAEQYLKAGNYFWNAGIFIYKVKTILSQLRQHSPGIMELIDKMSPYYFTSKESSTLNEYFPLCEKISIDFAVMEKSNEIYVISQDLGWSDLGTWSSVRQFRTLDRNGNTLSSDNVSFHECRGCMCTVDEDTKLIAVGLDNYIIAQKGNKLLICPLDREQDIKNFI